MFDVFFAHLLHLLLPLLLHLLLLHLLLKIF
jgi:hypothetical protein